MGVPLPNGHRDWAATLFGLFSIGAGGWFFYNDFFPWYAYFLIFFFGAFLVLPARTKIFGRQLTEWIPIIRGDD